METPNHNTLAVLPTLKLGTTSSHGAMRLMWLRPLVVPCGSGRSPALQTLGHTPWWGALVTPCWGLATRPAGEARPHALAGEAWPRPSRVIGGVGTGPCWGAWGLGPTKAWVHPPAMLVAQGATLPAMLVAHAHAPPYTAARGSPPATYAWTDPPPPPTSPLSSLTAQGATRRLHLGWVAGGAHEASQRRSSVAPDARCGMRRGRRSGRSHSTLR